MNMDTEGTPFGYSKHTSKKKITNKILDILLSRFGKYTVQSYGS
jgi:hypothetical protein